MGQPWGRLASPGGAGHAFGTFMQFDATSDPQGVVWCTQVAIELDSPPEIGWSCCASMWRRALAVCGLRDLRVGISALDTNIPVQPRPQSA